MDNEKRRTIKVGNGFYEEELILLFNESNRYLMLSAHGEVLSIELSKAKTKTLIKFLTESL